VEKAGGERTDARGRIGRKFYCCLVCGGGGETEPVNGRLGSAESIAKPTLKASFAFVFGESDESSGC
jgi:hypothetical protein